MSISVLYGREVAKGGAGGAATPPIFWRVIGYSDVITTMTSLYLKGSPMNVYKLGTSLLLSTF